MEYWTVPFLGSQMSLVKLALHTKADVKVLLRQCICMPSICICIKFRRS